MSLLQLSAAPQENNKSLRDLVYGPTNTPKGKPNKSTSPSSNLLQTQNYNLNQSQNQLAKKKGWLLFRKSKPPKANEELRRSSRYESMSNLDSKPESPSKKKYTNEDSRLDKSGSLAAQSGKWVSLPELSKTPTDSRPKGRATSPLAVQDEEDEELILNEKPNRTSSYDTDTIQEDSELVALETKDEGGSESSEDERKKRRADSPTSIDTFNSLLNSFESAIDAGKQAGYGDREIDQKKAVADVVDENLIESHLENLRSQPAPVTTTTSAAAPARKNAAAGVPSPRNQRSSQQTYEDAKLHSQVQVQSPVSANAPAATKSLNASRRSTSSALSSGSSTMSESSTDSVTNSNRLRNKPQIEQAHQFNAKQLPTNTDTSSGAQKVGAATSVTMATKQPTVTPPATKLVTGTDKPDAIKADREIRKSVETVPQSLASSAIETVTVSSVVKSTPAPAPVPATAPAPVVKSNQGVQLISHQRSGSHDQRISQLKSDGRNSPAALLNVFANVTKDRDNLKFSSAALSSSTGKASSTMNLNSSSKTGSTELPGTPSTSTHVRSTSGGQMSVVSEEVPAPIKSTVVSTAAVVMSRPTTATPSDHGKVTTNITSLVQKTPVTMPPTTPMNDAIRIPAVKTPMKSVVVRTPEVMSRGLDTTDSSQKPAGSRPQAKVSWPASQSQAQAQPLSTATIGARKSGESLTNINEARNSSTLDDRGRSAQPRITSYSKWRQVGPGTNIHPNSFVPIVNPNFHGNRNASTLKKEEKSTKADFVDRGRRSQSVGGPKAREMEGEDDRGSDDERERQEKSRSPEARRRPVTTQVASDDVYQAINDRKTSASAVLDRHTSRDNVGDDHPAIVRSHVELKLSSSLGSDQVAARQLVSNKFPLTTYSSNSSNLTGNTYASGTAVQNDPRTTMTTQSSAQVKLWHNSGTPANISSGNTSQLQQTAPGMKSVAVKMTPKIGSTPERQVTIAPVIKSGGPGNMNLPHRSSTAVVQFGAAPVSVSNRTSVATNANNPNARAVLSGSVEQVGVGPATSLGYRQVPTENRVVHDTSNVAPQRRVTVHNVGAVEEQSESMDSMMTAKSAPRLSAESNINYNLESKTKTKPINDRQRPRTQPVLLPESRNILIETYRNSGTDQYA